MSAYYRGVCFGTGLQVTLIQLCYLIYWLSGDFPPPLFLFLMLPLLAAAGFLLEGDPEEKMVVYRDRIKDRIVLVGRDPNCQGGPNCPSNYPPVLVLRDEHDG